MKTDWLRKFLIASIAVLSFLLIIRWNEFQERNMVEVSSSSSAQQTMSSSASTGFDDAISGLEEQTEILPEPTPKLETGRVIKIHTDVINVSIDTKGGDIVEVSLPKHYKEIDTPDDPFVLMKNDGNTTYLAQSGLMGKNGTYGSNKPRPTFAAQKTYYELQEGQEELRVDLIFQQSDSVKIIKRFTFTESSYLVNVSYIVDNQSDAQWSAAIYGQIKRDSHNPNAAPGLGMKPFLGAATTTNDSNYEKFDFGDIADETIKSDTKAIEHVKVGGWVAMVQHYFLSAFIPPQNKENKFRIFKDKNRDLYYLQFKAERFSVPAKSTGEQSFGFYAGPKDIKKLEKISPFLDLTVDYSFLWWIAKPLFYALDMIHSVVGNWGLAIIVLTFFIKLLFFYPSAASYRSMAKMRKIQPKMADLKERYGDDKQKFSQEMMKMYRQEKVNPLGGCLPILIQMPVFLALYWVLMESVELRHAPFFLWIQDLSVKDPFYILPLIMGATMFVQQKLNPTPPDPMQAKIMQMMPIFFTMLMLFFPAGLVLYWVVNNSLSITQQYVITKQIEKAG